MKIASALVCLLSLCSPGVHAQDKPSSPAPTQTAPPVKPAPAQTGAASALLAKTAIDPEKEKDIRHLLELTGTKALLVQTLDEMEKAVRPELENSLPAGPYREKLIEAFFLKFKTKFDPQKTFEMAVPIYDKHFSQEEIRGLIHFYETPLGQKTISVLPALTAELMSEGQKLGEEAARQSMMEVLAEHPDLAKQMEDAQRGSQP
ncbi:MAG TPA: DUF2059 domain-containing protein [Candidatus Acidoferrum sp.]|nr:DUF2059 domain-containing protein [Candidatus Acidoferrum sp.]